MVAAEWALAVEMQGIERFFCRRQDANKHVTVPDSVKELIISLRTFLQESCEPPVYVSDRRLLKSVAMLKVGLLTTQEAQTRPKPPTLQPM